MVEINNEKLVCKDCLREFKSKIKELSSLFHIQVWIESQLKAHEKIPRTPYEGCK